MVWKPHVTVAAVIEQDNRFLLVEEETLNGLQFNQPAGHLEENEDLIAAVKREVQEETGMTHCPNISCHSCISWFPGSIVKCNTWDSFIRRCYPKCQWENIIDT